MSIFHNQGKYVIQVPIKFNSCVQPSENVHALVQMENPSCEFGMIHICFEWLQECKSANKCFQMGEKKHTTYNLKMEDWIYLTCIPALFQSEWELV